MRKLALFLTRSYCLNRMTASFLFVLYTPGGPDPGAAGGQARVASALPATGRGQGLGG